MKRFGTINFCDMDFQHPHGERDAIVWGEMRWRELMSGGKYCTCEICGETLYYAEE